MKGNSSIIIINKDLCKEWLDVLTDCGINTIGLHSLYQYGGIDEFLNWLNRADVKNLVQEFKRAGIEIEYQLHAVNWLLPRADFFRFTPNGSVLINTARALPIGTCAFRLPRLWNT